jgi:hypothetical protein
LPVNLFTGFFMPLFLFFNLQNTTQQAPTASFFSSFCLPVKLPWKNSVLVFRFY